MKAVVANLAMYKVGWLACVLGAAAGLPWLGIMPVAVACAIHIASARSRSKTVLLLISAALIGFAWESFVIINGWINYGPEHNGLVAPYWIVAMWVLFATTLNLGFKWLKNHLWAAALVGGIGGPLAFAAGERLGAVGFSDPVVSLAIVGAGWAVLMPLMVYMARFLNGHEAINTSTVTA